MVENEEKKELVSDENKGVEEEPKKEEKKEEIKTPSLIEQAKEERKKIEEATAKMKEEREKLEKTASDMALAGVSKIDPTPEPTKHEEYIDRAKERYKGTGRDPSIGFKRQF